uniref:Uncharacterized protein n=1 Tax=Meloidogyne hapla TaxID=6305 RepID=A0A1I8AYN4_MELHA
MSQQQPQNNQNIKNIYVPSVVKKPWYITEEILSQRYEYQKIRLPPKEDKYPWNKSACSTSGDVGSALDQYREIMKEEKVSQSAIEDWEKRNGGWDKMH